MNHDLFQPVDPEIVDLTPLSMDHGADPSRGVAMRGRVLVAVMHAGLALSPGFAGDSGLPADPLADTPNVFATRDFWTENPALAAKFGTYTVLTLKAAEVRLTATSPSEFRVGAFMDSLNAERPLVDHVLVGAQVDWKFLVNLHAGIDLRKEQEASDNSSGASGACTTFTRPWIKAGIGYDIHAPAMSPFLRLEVAMAAAKQDTPGFNTSAEDHRKAVAADYEIGLYGGIRF